MVTVNGFFAIVCLICYAVGMFAIFLQWSRIDRMGMLSTMSTLSCCRILYRLNTIEGHLFNSPLNQSLRAMTCGLQIIRGRTSLCTNIQISWRLFKSLIYWRECHGSGLSYFHGLVRLSFIFCASILANQPVERRICATHSVTETSDSKT